jgi:tetratricopeptide (TPR) repeat protein
VKKSLKAQESQLKGWKYKAFISYRHGHPDTIIANYLYWLLKTDPLFKYWSQSEGVPQIERVYKDDAESSAAVDLNESIQQALRQSKSLIVVCSSRTFLSKWVPQEIDSFLEQNLRRRVVFLWTDDLTPATPAEFIQTVAAKFGGDVSGEDGKHEESWLKRVTLLDIRGKTTLDTMKRLRLQRVPLFTKILDGPAEKIKQADETLRKKKDRRLKTVIFGSVLLFLASVFLFRIITENIREEVYLQQRISKKSFYDLAGDLVDNSFRVPRVTREIKGIFAKDIERLTKHSRKLTGRKNQAAVNDLAADYALIGNIYQLCGDLPQAIAFHERSLATSRVLVKKDLSYGQAVDATSALINLGDLRMKQGDYSGAVADYQGVLKIRANYREQVANRSFWRRISYYIRDFLIWLRILEHHHSDQAVELALNQNVKVALQRMGNGYYLGGQYRGAWDIYQLLLKSYSLLPGIKVNTTQSWLQLADIYNRMGNIQNQLWNPGEAVNYYTNARQAVEKVLETDRNHKTGLYQLMLTYQYLGDARMRMGDFKGAMADYERSLANAGKLLPGLTEKAKTYGELVQVYTKMGNACLQMGETGKARTLHQNVIGMDLEIARQLTAFSGPGSSVNSLELGKAYLSAAYNYLMLNDSGQALAAAEKALEVGAFYDQALPLMAFGELLRGNVPEAKRMLSKAEAEQNRVVSLKEDCLVIARILMAAQPGNEELAGFYGWLIRW